MVRINNNMKSSKQDNKNAKNNKSRTLPNPDSVMVSQIHVIVIVPQTNKRLVTITCFTLKNSKMVNEIKISYK